MRKKHLILLGAVLLFAVVAFLFSPAPGPGFSQDAMQQAEDTAFGYELPCTPVTLVQDEVIEWQDCSIFLRNSIGDPFLSPVIIAQPTGNFHCYFRDQRKKGQDQHPGAEFLGQNGDDRRQEGLNGLLPDTFAHP